MGKYVYDALLEYTASDAYPMHMPGHKRRMGTMVDPYSIDITEIDGFDNLHHAEGILKEAQERAAALYGTLETHFLVNGSTCGILTAVSAALTQGRGAGRPGILMARNLHKAALHAAYLCGADPVWIRPEELTDCGETGRQLGGRIDPAKVNSVLEAHPEIGTVLIVSPTYDGVISDISAIAAAVHRHGALLIVDEAHGAHYGLHACLPASALQRGADLVIHSLHKTLPSLTQTALLHVNSPQVDRELIHRFLAIYQTSSPSYVLMASMDQCIRLLEERRDTLFPEYMRMLERFYASVRDLRMLEIVRTDDPSKILIFGGAGRLSGREICAILRKNYHLEPEMEAPEYALALSSVGDDEEGLVRLSEALCRIDEELFIKSRFGGGETPEIPQEAVDLYALPLPERRTSIRQAWDGPKKTVLLEEAAGETAAEPVFLYPPGIPVFVPGEQITDEQIKALTACRDSGFSLQGMEDMSMLRIRVLAE